MTLEQYPEQQLILYTARPQTTQQHTIAVRPIIHLTKTQSNVTKRENHQSIPQRPNKKPRKKCLTRSQIQITIKGQGIIYNASQ